MFFKKKSLGSPCYLIVVSGGSFFLNKDTRRCLLWCLQVSTNSSLLFKIEFWSAIRIPSFPVRHRSHARPPLENACPLALIMEVSIDGGRTRCHFFISETKRDFD